MNNVPDATLVIGHVPPPIVFCAVTVSTGAATTNPVTFVVCTDVAHTPVG
jgi:hypothetical protein